MDLSELIKCYSMEHKSLFTVFVIMLPVLFTIMYLHIPEFRPIDFYIQSIFVCTASILCVFASYIGVLACCTMADVGIKPNMSSVLIPLLLPSSALLLFPDNYGLGYSHVISVFSYMYLYIFAFFLGFSALLRIVKIFFESYSEHIKNKKKKAKSEN